MKPVEPELLRSWFNENKILQPIINALCDDLNTPKMLGIIFEHLTTIRDNSYVANAVKTFLQNVLGLDCKPLEAEATEEIKMLLQERETARAEKNWKRADELRAQLTTLGWTVKDGKL